MRGLYRQGLLGSWVRLGVECVAPCSQHAVGKVGRECVGLRKTWSNVLALLCYCTVCTFFGQRASVGKNYLIGIQSLGLSKDNDEKHQTTHEEEPWSFIRLVCIFFFNTLCLLVCLLLRTHCPYYAWSLSSQHK